MSDQTTPTTYSPAVSRLRSAYETQSEAANLSRSFGDTARTDRWGGLATQTLARLTRAGGNADGIDVADFQGQFDPTSADKAIGALSRVNGRRSNSATVSLNNKLSGVLEQRGLAQRQGEFNQNILPTFTGATDRMNQLAGTSAISAEQEGLLRSKIAATNRTSAASNLGRVSAALGLRGMSDSPAAAALASSVAQDYDVSLSNSLSDMGLQVSQMNREQARQDSGAAASLATLRINAENAYLSKDTEAVQSIGRDTAALIDALYSRDKNFSMLQDQADRAGNVTTVDRINQGLGIAKGVVGIAGSIATMGATSGASAALGGGTPSAPGPGTPGFNPSY